MRDLHINTESDDEVSTQKFSRPAANKSDFKNKTENDEMKTEFKKN